ncbi:hypothetical protein KAU32_09305 [bacterium]|nr:hypothetical protein [bacterium]
MKKFVVLTFLFLMISAVGFSQGLAIRPFVDIGASELGELVADYISVELIRSRQLSVISPSSVSAQLKEAKIIESGCSSDECNIAIAELLETEYLVFGTVEKKENGDYAILYQLYRTIRKSVIHMKEVSITIDSINDSVKDIAEDILHWTTGKQVKLFEHKDYENVNISALSGRVTGIAGKSYTLNMGMANGLRQNSYLYVMDADEIGAIIQISTILTNSSVARLKKIKIKGFKIQIGSPISIPGKVNEFELMARHRCIIMFDFTYSGIGAKYEYGMYYRWKPSIEISIGRLSTLALKCNLYLTTWFSLHFGVGIFHGETFTCTVLEYYPSYVAGMRFSQKIFGLVLELDISGFGQNSAVGYYCVGVDF